MCSAVLQEVSLWNSGVTSVKPPCGCWLNDLWSSASLLMSLLSHFLCAGSRWAVTAPTLSLSRLQSLFAAFTPGSAAGERSHAPLVLCITSPHHLPVCLPTCPHPPPSPHLFCPHKQRVREWGQWSLYFPALKEVLLFLVNLSLSGSSLAFVSS